MDLGHSVGLHSTLSTQLGQFSPTYERVDAASPRFLPKLGWRAPDALPSNSPRCLDSIGVSPRRFDDRRLEDRPPDPFVAAGKGAPLRFYDTPPVAVNMCGCCGSTADARATMEGRCRLCGQALGGFVAERNTGGRGRDAGDGPGLPNPSDAWIGANRGRTGSCGGSSRGAGSIGAAARSGDWRGRAAASSGGGLLSTSTGGDSPSPLRRGSSPGRSSTGQPGRALSPLGDDPWAAILADGGEEFCTVPVEVLEKLREVSMAQLAEITALRQEVAKMPDFEEDAARMEKQLEEIELARATAESEYELRQREASGLAAEVARLRVERDRLAARVKEVNARVADLEKHAARLTRSGATAGAGPTHSYC